MSGQTGEWQSARAARESAETILLLLIGAERGTFGTGAMMVPLLFVTANERFWHALQSFQARSAREFPDERVVIVVEPEHTTAPQTGPSE